MHNTPSHILRFTLPILVLAGIISTSGAAKAQDTQRIAAVVNEEVISVFDVQQRMQILIVSSGLPNTSETQRRIGPQVLRGLIDEILQQQESRRLNVKITERDMEDAVSRIEQSNNIPSGGFEKFLQNQRIALKSALSQIRASVAWQKLLSRTIVPTIEIGEEAIDDVVTRVENNRGLTEFRVSEILLPIDNPADASDIRSLAERLVQQLRDGADFRAVAQQFSKSATAALGGDIGWLLPGELEPAINTALKALTTGDITDPLAISDGITIIKLTDQRTNTPPDSGERTVKLRQLILLVEEDAPQSEVDIQLQKARDIASAVNGCTEFAAVAEESGTPQPEVLGKFKLNDLNAQLRSIAASIPVGQASEPLRQPSGLQILMVCERQNTSGPSRDAIRQNLLRERVDMLSRRYLRDLRRAAFVDLRV
ncbi:MAG: peptidylprolyl isomerase [Alphaproteobacteria bacterium]|nr:peptidylprolyl isomerase [Alphaproteobacteria bacterium]